jgi:antitoxin MazE
MNEVYTKMVRIGNSRGVRIPKTLIDQMGFTEDVKIIIEPTQLVLRPVTHIRKGWDEQFRQMAKNGDDVLLDKVTLTKWDRSEWEW